MGKTSRAKPSAEKHALNQAETRARNQAVDDARNLVHSTVTTLARNHRRSKRWANNQVYIPQRRKRNPSPWNGFIQQKLRVANEGLPIGSRQLLIQFLRAHSTELRVEYKSLSQQQRDNLVRNLQIVPEKCIRVIRDSPQAHSRRVTTGFKKLTVMLSAFVALTGLEMMVIAVRGQYRDINKPEIYCTSRMEDFTEDVLGMTVEELALKGDGYVVSGLRLTNKPVAELSRKILVSKCRTHIQKGLQTIVDSTRTASTKRKVIMNYDNYERRIVETYSIALVGWPFDRITNPGSINAQAEVALLACALDAKKCKWVKLSPKELSARKKKNQARQVRHGDVYKARKQTAKATRSVETIQDSDEEEEQESG
ncbi:hypothetical protein BDN72DRAFT_863267 [Pluteus cervinus]|uniref:Uncharacterized protein n=1 Tax=Pluteus cervinus TaxID=181527 RepID=A0ACD3A865_9AGAR|nr:hypothetical protein BDN72DRAFT_863267 [Pluteus cervinus]